MGIAFVKKLNEKTPYWIKAPFSNIIRNKLIKNKLFIDTMEMLVSADHLSDEMIKERQLRELKKTLEHAYNCSLYYKKLFDECSFCPASITKIEDIQSIPVLTNQKLNDCLDEIAANDILDFYEITTGGTTGKPTKVLMEKNAIYREWAFVYHYWLQFGYDCKKSRLATFRGVNMGKKLSSLNPLYREIRMNVFMMSNANIHEYVRRIDRFGADFIYGYPSSVYHFCRLAKDNGIDLKKRYKAVFLVSENLYPFQEKKIREVLDVPVAMFYGHSERVVFAEKYSNGYRFNPLYGVTEISDKGEPIVTGFINGKTPMIRYLVDDCVRKIDQDHYEIEGHRNLEIIYGNNGEEFPVTTLNFHGQLSSILSNYQIVQNEYGKIELQVLVSDGIREDQKAQVIKKCNEVLNGVIQVSVREVENLKYSKGSTGKYRMLIQNIPVRGRFGQGKN